MKLEVLGFNNWFQTKYNLNSDNGYSLARVTAVDKSRILIRNEENECVAACSCERRHPEPEYSRAG